MKKLKLRIKFNGHNYSGWQIQPFDKTVQGELNKALKAIYKKEVKTIGSGRTDAKVHSLDHHVSFIPPFEIDVENLVKALNSNLPADIRAYDCMEVNDDFRPTNDAVKKEYRYLFTNNKIESPFQINLMSNISKELDLDAMQSACKVFIGEFDFKNFQCTGSEPGTTVREIFECELLRCSPDLHGIFEDHFYLRVVGSGFLKQMVRLIVGAIWAVGKGKISEDDIKAALELKTTGHLSAVAPPQGLYKYKVYYKD